MTARVSVVVNTDIAGAEKTISMTKMGIPSKLRRAWPFRSRTKNKRCQIEVADIHFSAQTKFSLIVVR